MAEEASPHKKIILSGIQPTGVFTLGNYIGAIQNWERMQRDYRCAYFIADLHALTVRQEPGKLRAGTLSALAQLMACGIDPKKSLLFVQSHVPEHAEMSWLLSCHTQFGELSRMTQFKDKSAAHADNINAGLFTYPALMAADILLYQADYVPVGDDQRQHLELTRDIAVRMNGLYGNLFTLPEAYLPKQGARIRSLADPTKKMSKSDPNPNGAIYILDPPEVILKKVKRAVTDSEARVAYGEGKDGVNNLMTIYAAVTGRTTEEIEAEFEGHGYGDFKQAVGEAVAEYLRPVRERYTAYLNDRAYLEEVCKEGAAAASAVARRTLSKVKKKLGLLMK